MASKEPIHSGHFMTSNPHTEISPDDEDEDVEVDVVDVDDTNSAVQPADKSAAKGSSLLKDEDRPVTFYKFGSQKTQSIVIDQSLNKLNRCIRVAYMKMTTPKWKDFKGLKLQWKHRIRLNNVIWRAYYMEFRKPGRRGKTPYCYFSVPDDDTTHTKIEGSILEGMYWKRRMEAVCAQYKRWRTYNRNKARKKCCRKRCNSLTLKENSCGCDKGNIGLIGLDIAKQAQQNGQHRSLTPDNLSTGNNGLFFDFDDDLDNEFTNQLFEQLNAPFLFPNPKENGALQCANADIMQPGLLSLQPSIEEIMSTDFPFAADESLSEFANSLPLATGEAPAPHFSQPAVKMMMASMPQQYTDNNEKEYDDAAAIRLVQYNNQQRTSHNRHSSSTPVTSSMPVTFFRQPSLANASHVSPAACPSSVTQPAMPVPVITPNISHPLYSQAAVYGPQQLGQMAGGQQRTSSTTSSVSEQQQFIISNSMSPAEALNSLSHNYSTNREKRVVVNPPMATKMANQPSHIPLPITSIASSAASQILPAFNYSILAASTVANVVAQAAQLGHISRRGSLLTTAHSWSSSSAQNNGWTASTQQDTYATAQTQHTEQKTTNGLFRPPSAASTDRQMSSSSSSPLSSTNFTTQSLLSPSATLQLPSSCGAPSLANLVAVPRQNAGGIMGGRQSAIALHLQQQPKTQQQMTPLLSPLSSTNSGAATIQQFMMNDLSRYLTQQQQSPTGQQSTVSVGQLHASPLPCGSSAPPSNGLRLNTAYMAQGMSSPEGHSPNAPPRYQHHHSAPTPSSAPVLGSFSPHTTTKSMDMHAISTLSTRRNSPSKKTSSATLPPPISEQMHSLPKKGRGSGSFSGAQRHFHSTKRQKHAHEVDVSAQQGPSSFDEMESMDNNTTFSTRQISDSVTPTQCVELVSAPKTTSSAFSSSSANNWAFKSRRQPSTDSFRFSSPLPSPTSHHQQQQQLHHNQQLQQQQQQHKALNVIAPQLALSRRKGPTVVNDFIQLTTAAHHEFDDESQQLGEYSPEMQMATALLGLSEQIKEEKGDDGMLLEEKPSAVTMGHKRRHHGHSNGSSAPSSSQSEQADSTLHPEERKRILHLHAEKNRRYALKEGFEALVQAIPVVEQTGVKCTNAVVLNRGAQHIRQLRGEQEQQQMKLRMLREKITSMNERIALIQSNLPSTSTAGSRSCETQSPSMRIQVEQFFEHYKKERSREDFRFWLMGEVLKPIVLSFADQIHPDPSDHERVLHSLKKWLDTHWNASVLRPIASDVLVRVATASGAFTGEAALSNYIMNKVRNASSSNHR